MNSARKPLVAGNWKMNAGGADGCDLGRAVGRAVAKLGKQRLPLVDVVVAPPFTALAAVSHELRELDSTVTIAAQNMHHEAKGAYTGEIGASMLKDAGASWVILGHSERRHGMDETDDAVARKTAAAFAAELKPIVCVGETLEERDAGETVAVVERQVRAVLDLLADHPGVGVIAYEPVWAIGTGQVAAPEDAQQVHAAIRGWLADTNSNLAAETRILYGGSVTGDSAAGLFAQKDIDGALVGGASLKADGFSKIVVAAIRQAVAADEPEADEPDDETPDGEQSGDDASRADEPDGEQSGDDASGDDEPDDEESGDDEPDDEESGDEEPDDEESGDEEPDDEEPGDDEPEPEPKQDE